MRTIWTSLASPAPVRPSCRRSRPRPEAPPPSPSVLRWTSGIEAEKAALDSRRSPVVRWSLLPAAPATVSGYGQRDRGPVAEQPSRALTWERVYTLALVPPAPWLRAEAPDDARPERPRRAPTRRAAVSPTSAGSARTSSPGSPGAGGAFRDPSGDYLILLRAGSRSSTTLAATSYSRRIVSRIYKELIQGSLPAWAHCRSSWSKRPCPAPARDRPTRPSNSATSSTSSRRRWGSRWVRRGSWALKASQRSVRRSRECTTGTAIRSGRSMSSPSSWHAFLFWARSLSKAGRSSAPSRRTRAAWKMCWRLPRRWPTGIGPAGNRARQRGTRMSHSSCGPRRHIRRPGGGRRADHTERRQLRAGQPID